MRVMGIDPSTKTGVAVVDSGKKVVFTTEVEFKKMTGFERVSSLAGRMIELKEEYKPDLIVIEDMFVGHASSAITIIQIGSILRYFLWQEGVPYLDVGPTVLKKFVSGKGNSKKEEMMMHVLKKWNFTSPTNNIADAVGLAMFGLCCLGEKFDVASLTLANDTVSGAPFDVRKSIRDAM